ncbi:MAG: HD domain-containing phosphohydrolase [Fervidobacterium sp.]
MMKSRNLTKLILKKNLLIALIVSGAFSAVFFIWFVSFISRDSLRTFEIIDKSFEKTISSLANNITSDRYEMEEYINSYIQLVKTLIENENSKVDNAVLEQLKNIYINSLPPEFVDLDLAVCNKYGQVLSATGLHADLARLNFAPVKYQDNSYPRFLSFVPNTRRLVLYTWVQLEDNFLIFAFYIDPRIYNDLINAFTMNKIGNIIDIAIYINKKTRLDSSVATFDEQISNVKDEKIVKKYFEIVYYKMFVFSKYDSLVTPLYIKVTLNYINFVYIISLFILVFIITVLIFTYTSSSFSVSPFINDLAKLNAAIQEVGNTGVLPPASGFTLEESQDFYETLSAMLEELSATTEELEATNAELERAYNDIAKKSEDFKELLLNISERLAVIAEGYDENTGHHIYRVKLLSGFLAEKLGLDEEVVESIRMFASLHDIGKIFVPKDILQKPGKLTAEEWEIMRQHTIFAKRILDIPGFERALSIALYHHENYDGTGYPFGLKEGEIPIDAHIVKLVDTYDALRSERPYKRSFTHEEAMKVILEGDGRTSPEHFDQKLLEVFRKYSEEIKILWESIK